MVVNPPAQPPGGGAPGTSPPAATPPGYRLTLLHNNDGESKLLTGDSVTNYGGAARFATVLARLRQQAEAYGDEDTASGRVRKGTMLVSSGDNFLAGLNLNASFAKGVPWYDSLAFARLGYDAATLGNHEFDFGPDRLADFIQGDASSTPFLSANLDFQDEPRLKALADQGRIRRSVVIQRGGDQIGVIGVTTPDISNIASPGRVRIDSDLAGVVNREARALESAGVNKIVLSSHLQGIAAEKALIPQLQGVDIVIAGGGDELLANPQNALIAGQGSPVAPYPIIVRDKDGRGVPAVTTQGEFRYVGRLTAHFNGRGIVTVVDTGLSGPVRVSGNSADPDLAERDATIASQVDQPLEQYRAAIDANVIATTQVGLDGRNPDPIRRRESNLGNLVADSFLYAANKEAVAQGRPLANVAFTNGGGIRNGNVLGPGSISEGDTFRILPFDNIVVTVPGVPRDQFKELMENGYSVVPSTSSAGRFAHVAGFRVAVDTTRQKQETDAAGNVTTPGQRVRQLTLDDGTPIVANGAVVPGPALNVATVDFLARGGDFYPFRGRPSMSSTIPYQRALFRYLTEPVAQGALGGTVTAADYPSAGEGRITLTP